jgi:hypothetical protein
MRWRLVPLSIIPAVALLAGSVGAADARHEAYQGSLTALCVRGTAALDARPSTSFTARLDRTIRVLTPLQASARTLVPPGPLATAHRQMLRSLSTLLTTTKTFRTALRHMPPALALVANRKALSSAATGVRASFSKLGAWPCSNLIAAVQQTLAIDTKAPTVRALPSSGSAGMSINLRYTLADDSSTARAILAVYAGTRTLVKPTTSAFARARKGVVQTTGWVAPTTGTKLRFCVRGQDRAGNTSKWSCAAIKLH